MTITALEVLTLARTAAEAKALAIWDRDGKEDRGSCGSAIMYLKGNTKLAKEAIAHGFASAGGDISVKHFIPAGVCSQSADIYQDSMSAFREVLIAYGHEKAIKKFWTYID
jgi:hypothetical protein